MPPKTTPALDMRPLLRSCLLGTLIGLGMPASATGLQALLSKSLTQHPLVLQANNQARAAGHDLSSAQWGRYPSLSTELRSDSGPNQGVTRVEQPLWTGGKITGRIKAAEAGERVAQAQLEEARTQVLTQLTSAYFEWLRQEARLEGARRSVEEHERLLALIQRRARSEISPPSDETLARTRLQQAISERIQIARQRDAARVNLNQWSSEPVERVTPPRSVAFVHPGSSARAVEKALNASPAYRRLQAQIEAAQAQIDLSQAQGMPNVVAGYQRTWGHLYNGQQRDAGYVSLQFTPGAGLSALSQRQAAASRKDAVRDELAALQLSLAAQVNAALTEVDALAAQVQPARALLDGTSEVVESYLRQYQIGRKNWLDVLNAQREKTSAIYNLADTQYNHQLAQVRLMLQTGDLHSEDLSAIHD